MKNIVNDREWPDLVNYETVDVAKVRNPTHATILFGNDERGRGPRRCRSALQDVLVDESEELVLEKIHVRLGNWISAMRFGHGIGLERNLDVIAVVAPKELRKDRSKRRNDLLQFGALRSRNVVELKHHVIQVDLVVQRLQFRDSFR